MKTKTYKDCKEEGEAAVDRIDCQCGKSGNSKSASTHSSRSVRKLNGFIVQCRTFRFSSVSDGMFPGWVLGNVAYVIGTNP